MEKLTNIELDSIQLHGTKPRDLSNDSSSSSIIQEDDIETAHGSVHVDVQGDRSKPAIFTYHDIGLSGPTSFSAFFNHPDMQPLVSHFCIYHITAPGQMEGALPLPHGTLKHSESAKLLDHARVNGDVVAPDLAKKRISLGYTGDPTTVTDYHYPTMDDLAEMFMPIMQFYGLKRFLGFGCGAGANILARFAIAHKDKVDGLVLINCSATTSSWTEWGHQKVNVWYLKSHTLSPSVEDYLLCQLLGSRTIQSNHDLVQVYSSYLRTVNPHNLGMFIDSFIRRSDLGIERELDPTKKNSATMIRCPVMLVSGDYSPQLDDTIAMNSRLDPVNSTWIKYECGGLVMEEVPDKLCESFRLFLQGMGYVPSLSRMHLGKVPSRMSSDDMGHGHKHGAAAQPVC